MAAFQFRTDCLVASLNFPWPVEKLESLTFTEALDYFIDIEGSFELAGIGGVVSPSIVAELLILKKYISQNKFGEVWPFENYFAEFEISKVDEILSFKMIYPDKTVASTNFEYSNFVRSLNLVLLIFIGVICKEYGIRDEVLKQVVICFGVEGSVYG